MSVWDQWPRLPENSQPTCDPEQLNLIKEGALSWNSWIAERRAEHVRESIRTGVGFSPTLEGAELQEANLADVDFQFANLQSANLEYADLKGANLSHADLSKARLRGVNLEGACLIGTTLVWADLANANLKGANISYADLKNARLTEATLEDADIRHTDNLLLHSTFIRNARFDARASDPWSVLRRTYTGPSMIFTLILLIIFALPYVAKLAFWSAVNEGQNHIHSSLDHSGVSSAGELIFSPCMQVSCNEMPVWQIVLGVDNGQIFLMTSLCLILYNVLRGGLTYIVAPMRDAEERSGYSPDWVGRKFWQGYRQLYIVHRVVSILALVAAVAFLVNAKHWLSLTVWLPAATEMVQ